MSARCLLTLCLTAIGSYMKPACRKNTFHINLPGPLVETFALMNHNLSQEGECVCSVGLYPKELDAPSDLAGYLESHWKNGLWFLAGQSSIVSASVLLRGLPGQMESVMHCSSSRAEQRVHGCQGYGWTRDIFHRGGGRRKAAERTDAENSRGDLVVWGQI